MQDPMMNTSPAIREPVAMTENRGYLRLAWWMLALAAFLHAAAFFIPQVQGFGEYVWRLNYSFGFIRRGLLGQLFSVAAGPMAPLVQDGAVILLHRLVFTAVFFSMAFWTIRSMLTARDRGPAPVAGILLAAALAFTPMWPTQSWLVGYADIFVMGAAFIGFVACETRQLPLTLVIAATGPLLHESFLFLWMPVVLLGVADIASRRTPGSWHSWAQVGAVAAVPVLAAWVLQALHDPAAVEASLARAKFSDPGMKQVLLDQVFNARPGSLMAYMRHLFTTHSWTVTLVAPYMCMVPAIVSVAIARGTWRAEVDRAGRGATWAAWLTVAACWAPLAILLIAWDLSRLLATMTFAATIVHAHAARAGWLDPLESSVGRVLAACVLTTSLVCYVGTPLPYAYFNEVHLIGPQSVHGPAGWLAVELKTAVNNPPPAVAPATP